jgi:hypothetical protein
MCPGQPLWFSACVAVDTPLARRLVKFSGARPTAWSLNTFSFRTRTPFQQIPHQGMNMSDIVWAYPTKDGRGAVEVMFSNATSGEPCATLTPTACLRACTTNHAAWACWLSFHVHDREIS